MKDLAAHIRDLIDRYSPVPETARTNHENTPADPLGGIYAICARGFGATGNPHLTPDPEMVDWSEDARFTYEERLAIGNEQGMDTSVGSEAEQVARREARRVAAGIPGDFPTSRKGDLIDEVLAAFEVVGRLTHLRTEAREPGP
ncbi:MAG: hypothetical protein JNK70_12700, partial [Phycisphaerae bacterium]|nr:hypothetical protein [Phycisphaerae bacterium]